MILVVGWGEGRGGELGPTRTRSLSLLQSEISEFGNRSSEMDGE